MSLSSLPKRALNNIDIETFATKLKIPHFRGVFMRNNLPKKIRKNESGVINLDNNEGNGTHWTAYKKTENLVIYFDSYGNLKPPLEAIKYFNSNNLCDIRYNHRVYQTYNSYNCGHLCLQFLYN